MYRSMQKYNQYNVKQKSQGINQLAGFAPVSGIQTLEDLCPHAGSVISDKGTDNNRELHNGLCKMMGITPEVFTFNGMLEVCPPTIFLPCIFLAYCTGILRTPSFKMITRTTMAIIIAKMITTARIAVAGAFPNTNCSNRLLRS